MINYVQVGTFWLNTAQVRAVQVFDDADGTLTCTVEFDREHVLTFTGDDARVLRGYLSYHMKTPTSESPGLPM